MRERGLVAVVIVVLLLVGCGGDTSEDNPDPDNVPAPEMRVLDDQARASVTGFDFAADNNEGEVRFDADSDFAGEVTQGAILASRPIEGDAPYGMLQRVKSVRTEGDTLVATTRQATLAESFERADFEMSREVDPDIEQANQGLRPGVSVQGLEPEGAVARQGVGRQAEINFDQVLLDTDGDQSTTNDQLKLNGRVAFGVGFDTAVKIRRFEMRRFLLAVDLEQSVDIEVVGDFDDAEIDKRKKVYETNIKTITFQIGPVPVVIKIDLLVFLGADGTISAQVRAGAEQSSSTRLGVEYTDTGGWGGIKENSRSFQIQPPEFSFNSVNARAYARPQLEVKLYGLSGPYIFAEPFLRFSAEVYTSPFWELYGGLNFGAGLLLRVPVVGEVGDFEASFTAFEERITKSNNKEPTLDIVSPQDGTTVDAGSIITITAKAEDRESEDVDIDISGSGATASALSREGSEENLVLAPLCEGVNTLTVTATDGDGATTSKDFTVVVENVAPNISIDTSTLTGSNAPPIFPGGFVSAGSTLDDPGCAEAEPLNAELMEWYIDGERVSRSVDLLTRLPAAEYSTGDTVSIQARYSDGNKVGMSQTVDVTLQAEPAGDLPTEVAITRCNACGHTLTGEPTYWRYPVLEVSGVAYDPKEGELSGSRLTWELAPPRSSAQTIGTGESASYDLSEDYDLTNSGVGDVEVRLIVDDDSGEIVVTDSFEVELGS